VAELFRHAAEGYALSIYTPHSGNGLVVDAWPEGREGSLVCVELSAYHARRLLVALQQRFGKAAELASGGVVEPSGPLTAEGPEVNGLATHLCSFDGCYPAPCADHLSTAGAALKWVANRRALAAEPGPERTYRGTCEYAEGADRG
jgi:hypothetical protein